ncbi:hypothetical protein HpNP137_08860 [Helicobacter pylori]
MDLKIQTEKIGKGLKELSKILISYPFEKHVEALGEQCSNSVSIPINNDDYSNICTFVSDFINLIDSYKSLGLFLDFYKEKLKLSELVTEYANATNNLLFKELIKHVSGNSEWIKTFCQHIKEIIKRNTPDKKYNTDEFFVMGEHKQNQLSKIYSYFKKLSEGKIKPQNEDILKKLKSLDEIFKTIDFNTKFAPKTKVKDIIKEIDEKYPINENFKQQFRTFRSNIISLKKRIKNSLKDLEKIRKDFKRKKESWIKEIENYCESEYNSEKESKINYDVLLDNIQQICKKYIASHVANDVSKDMKYMMCQFYLEKMELLSNSKIRRYQYDDLLKSARKSLWESIKILDDESGARLFPKNLKGIKEKFEDNKEKFKQSKNYYEFAEYCRFFQSLFNKTDFNPTTIWHSLETKRTLQIKFDKNNDLEVYFGFDKSFVIPKKYLQEIDQELLKEIRRSDYPFPKCEYHNDNNMVQLTFSKDDAFPLMVEVSLVEILEYNMQLKMDSSIAKEFNELLAIAQDSPQDNYRLKIRVRHNNKFSRDKEYTAYEIKLEIHDCRKSDNQNPIILSQQSTGFQWAFNFMFGFLYNVGSNFSFNHNIIYVMDEPATHLSAPARKEFRKFLKEYAHKNHVTFVVATHDPFLVDTDHLDEIRIVEKETEDSAIKNNFNYPLNNASKDSDALYQIKRSLGVGQHVFHNPQKHRIIFVEGITDYCYLSAFKLYFNEREFKDNPFYFTFLPISGLKKESNEMKETIQKLCELDNNPIVLIDDDRKCVFNQKATSERFKKANEDFGNPITILQLSKCDENFKQIEDCFSTNDRKKYAKNKRMELAMAFKTRLLYSGKDDVMSEETKENFKKLFEWIKKECNNPTIKKEYIKFDYNTPQIL